MVIVGVFAAGLLAACGEELPPLTAPIAPPATPDGASDKEAAGGEASGEAAGEVQSSAIDDDALGPSGGPGVGAREDTLTEAIAEHIAALNGLDRRTFVAVFLDDCGDGESAGALSYAFGAPLVEAGTEASSDFVAIRFLADDRARVEYVTELPPDIWVVHERRWRISTCAE